jgi:leucine-zipper of insertion element IS481
MNIHKNARLTPPGRLLLVQRVEGGGWGLAAAAMAAGISERQSYRWLARYRSGGVAALADRSSAPQCCKHRMAAVLVRPIAWSNSPLACPCQGMPSKTGRIEHNMPIEGYQRIAQPRGRHLADRTASPMAARLYVSRPGRHSRRSYMRYFRPAQENCSTSCISPKAGSSSAHTCSKVKNGGSRPQIR